MTVCAARSLRARLALTTALAGVVMALPGVAAGQVGVVSGTPKISSEAGAALPTFVSGGTVNATTDNTTTKVTLNAQSTVIDWTVLNVLSGPVGPKTYNQALNFINNVGASGDGNKVAVLNRVSTGTTTISGAVNGLNSVTTPDATDTRSVEVWLSNPNGLIIGNNGAINTNGLVLTTLPIGAFGDAGTAFIGATGVRLVSAAPATDQSSITSSGTFNISSNGGVLAVIAPVVQLAGTGTFDARDPAHTAGVGGAAFVAATDVTMQSAGSPLSLKINQGTTLAAVGNNLDVAGTVQGGTVAMVLSAQSFVDTLLNVSANVTATATTGKGVVILAGNDSTNADSASLVSFGSGDIAGGGRITQTGTINTGTSGLVLGARSTPANPGGLPPTPAGAGTISATGLTTANLSAKSAGDLIIAATNANAVAATTVLRASNGQVSLTGNTGPLAIGGGALGGASGTVTTLNTAGVLSINAPTNSITGGVSLTGGGGITLAGNVTGATSVQLNSAVTLATDAIVSSLGSASTGTINFASTVVGGQALTVTSAGTKTFSGTLGAGAGNAVGSILSNGGGATAFAAGATSATTSGTQNYGAVTLAADTVFTGTDGTFGGTITGNSHALDLKFTGATGLAAVTGVTTFTTENGGTTTLNGNVTTTGVQTYTDDVTLGAGVTVDAGANNITFAGALGGGFALQVNSTGTSSFATVGAGAGNALASLAVNSATLTGGNTVLKGSVTTSGAQVYFNPVTTTVANGTVPVQTLTSTTSGGITFNSTLDGTNAAAGSRQQLALSSTGGSTAFNGAVGATTRFASLNVSGPATVNANVTADAVTFGGAVTVAGTRTIATAAVFNGTVGGDTVTPGNLTLTGGGTATQGLGTGANALASLTVNGALDLTGNVVTTGAQAYNGTLTVHGSSTLSGASATFNGAYSVRPFTSGSDSLAVNLSGAQAIDAGIFTDGTNKFANFTLGPTNSTAGAKTLTGTFLTSNSLTFNDPTILGGNVVLTTGSGGAAINGAMNAAAAGSQTLTIHATSASLAGVIGGSAALGALTTDPGSITAISANVTANTQTYNGAVAVSASPTLTAATSMAFNGGVSGGGALTLAGAGTRTFALAGGVVSLGSLTSGAGGGLAINGGGVTTTGGQSYADAVTLGATTTTLTGTTSSITGTLAGGGNDLTLNFSGASTVDGSLVTGVRNLQTGNGGPTTLLNTITTTGTQTYNDNILLGTGTGTTVTVAAGANAITFGAAGSVDAVAAGVQSLVVNTTGLTTFAGPVGNTTAPYRLTATTGPVTIGVVLNPPTIANSIKTTDSQSYGAVTLGANTVLNGATVSVAGAITGNSGGVDHDLTLTTTAAKSLSNASFTGVRNFTANGGGAITLNGDVTTSGFQTYSDATKLGASVTLTSSGTGVGGNADITFGSTLDANAAGVQLLKTDTLGTTVFNGVVGGTALQSIKVGKASIGANVTTTTFQTYSGAVTLTNSATLTSNGSGSIGFGSTVDAAANGIQGLTVATTGTTTFAGAVGGAALGSTKLASVTTNLGGAVVVGGGSVRTAGVPGSQSYSGQVSITTDTVFSGTTVNFLGGLVGNNHDLTLTTTGVKAISGTNITGVRSLVANGGGVTTLSGTITTTGNQTYSDMVTLASATTAVATVASDGSAGVGSNISFANTVDATTAGVQSLVVTTAGTTTFGASVGNSVLLNNLTTSAGPISINTASIKTAGNQSYGGAATLGGPLVLTAGTATTTGGISFASTVNANPLAAATGYDLTLTSNGAKAVTGGFTGVHDLLANGGGATTLSGVVVTNGKQTYSDAVTLAATTTATSSASGVAGNADITFGSTVNAAAAGVQGLTINTAGATTFNNAVGGTAALASITTDLAGTTVIATSGITTTGPQLYNDPVTLATAAAPFLTTLTATAGGAITFANTVDALTSGVQKLTIGTGGTATFASPVGQTTALGALTANAVTTAINGGYVRTTGPQQYLAVTLGAPTQLLGNPVSFSGVVTGGNFDLTLTEGVAHTVDGGLITGVRNLVVNGGGTTTLSNTLTTSGNQTYANAVLLGTATTTAASTGAAGVGAAITFNNTVGATTNGGQGLIVNTPGATTFNFGVGGALAGASKLAFLRTDQLGTTTINGGSVLTTGDQNYLDPVTLGATTVLQATASGNINLANTVDAAAAGVQALSVLTGGTTTFGNPVGATRALASVTTDAPGQTQINGTYVGTTGDQIYNDAVTIGASANLVSSASGTINFVKTLDGAMSVNPNLTVATGGATIFGGAVGGSPTGSTKIGRLITDQPGTTAINGGSVVTALDQIYNDQVTLGQSTVLTGTTGAFKAGLVGAGFDLTLNFSAASSLDSTITGVRNLVTDAPGGTTLSGTILTSGNQTYNDAVTLGAATTLTSTNSAGVGGVITLGGAVDGAQALVINTNDVTRFVGVVGDLIPLTSIVTDAAGSTLIAAPRITTTGLQTYNDPVKLASTATLTSKGAGAITFATTVDAQNDGVQGLRVNTAGATIFGGAVGGAVAGPTRLASLTTDAGGTTALLAGSVVTTGNQTYGDALQLSIDTHLTSTANGTLALASVDGGNVLSLNTGGATQLNGVLGGTAPLTGLALRTGTFSAVAGNRVGTIAASVTNGGLVYNDAGALTVGTVDGLSGISTGTAATTVSAGGLLTLATNVAAGNTSLTGTGITQAAGAGVNAGAGTILLDGNDGAFALAGLLTTTNGTATAVQLVDSGMATLGTIVTGAGGSVTLGLAGADNLGGNVTQTAGSTITTGTLLGSIGGSATLTNANNNIATLGMLGANGLFVRDSRAGVTVAGPVSGGTGNLTLALDSGTLALQGNLVATAGTITLTSGGAISQTAGTITADTLTGSSTGGASLTAAGNTITRLGSFTNSGSGGFALTDSRSLTLTGDAAITGDTTITAVGIDFTGRTIAATGALTLAGGTGAVTGATATAGTNATVTGASINVATARANGGALAMTAGAGGLSVGIASAATTATLGSQGALAVTGSLTSGTTATLTATGAATLAQTNAGSSLAVTANGITASGTTKSGTTMTLTSGGGIALTAAATAGTDASFDANGTASLAAVTAGSGSGITIRALDAQITGAQTAAKVTFVNRSPTTIGFKLGDGTSAGGFQLSQAEINLVNAGSLTVDGGTGNVELGTLAFAGAAGSTSVAVLATGRIDVLGAVSGGGAGRLFRFGGTAATASDKASVIEVTAKAAGGGGSLLFGSADLDLRGNRIGVGQAAGFLTPVGFDGASGQSVAAVSTAYVGNANSSLYNATFGGIVYQPSGVTLVSANTLAVRYTDYALFQNTGAPGVNAGVVLGGSVGAPVKNALVIEGTSGSNAFALFGTINGINGSGTALLGSQVINFSNVNLANSRVNGCLVGSGGGCLSSVVSQPVLNVFDSSRLNVFRSADDLAVPFDPVVGNNNEALFSGASVIDAPITDTACTGPDDPSCKPQDQQAPKGVDDKKGK